ncbi:MAG: lamin tail domain-containing protein, partial [Flavobacteriales bacterium]
MKGHSAHSNQPTTALPRFRVGRLRGVVAMLSLCVGLGASAQATDLIISEYIEGSSNNKYIEIYNGTGASVNLANYQLLLYANGSATISTTGTPAMTGMLADGATVVYKNSGAALAFVGAIVNSAVSYNGDDAIVLDKISPAGFVDIFGNIGCDPGSAWTSGTFTTVDRTLVRNPSSCAGVTIDPTNTSCPFPSLASDWTQLPLNDITNLGSHTMTCAPAVPDLEFAATSTYRSVLENVVSTTFTLNFSTATHSAGTAYISLDATSTAAHPADYNSTSFSGAMIQVAFPANGATTSFITTIVNDGLPESAEYVLFTLDSVSYTSGITVGTVNKSTLVISDVVTVPTVLNPGDLVIVGVNANNNVCASNPVSIDDDQISFFCFKDITPNTQLILTDNGYERCFATLWANSEGTLRITRTGNSIPAGQVITLRMTNSVGSGNVLGLAPDASWSCASIGSAGTMLQFNSNGDQIFFMQGGVWGTGSAGAHNATYSGTILYGFSSNQPFPWVAACPSISGDPASGTARSNLPPGVECFSLAKAVAKDYFKYTGLRTAASQRDWIIRIDNDLFWTAFDDCSGYNGAVPDWLKAPIMPIIPGAMTPGRWRGSTNTDWFECRNWDDARVPTAITPVVINETWAANACNVGISPGLNPGGTAQCASLAHSSNSAVLRNLTVRDNSTLNIAGAFTIQHTAGSGALSTTVYPGATLNAASVSITGINPAAINEAVLSVKTAGSVLNVSGNLTIGNGGFLDLNGGLGSGTVSIGGNWNNVQDETHFKETNGLVNFNGAVGPQTLSIGTGPELFHNIRVNKASGHLTLNTPIRVQNNFDFVSGQVFSTATNLITMASGATTTSASDASYVDGPILLLGGGVGTTLPFPVGKNGHYRPASLLGSTGNSINGFIGEYFNVGYPVLLHDAILHHVSACEYWEINRNNLNTQQATIQLTWRDPVSCGVTLVEDLRTAYYNGTNWLDRGAANVTPLAASGSIETLNVQTSFLQANNYWTLGSLSTQNPLPIELISFTAKANGDHVDLAWATASEKDNDHFNVERSADALDFAPISEVAGAGNSQ